MARKKQSDQTLENKIRILIVDDHPIVRQGLAELVNHEEDFTVCGQAEDYHEALRAIGQLNPNIAVVDISLKESSGLELIKDIHSQHPDLPVLALSMHDETLYAERALRAGAMGYIMKQEATENVIAAIRRVLDGEIYVSERMASRMVRKLVTGQTVTNASPVDSLSDRELEVFRLIGKGHGTRQISKRLCLSVKTIETYRAHIKDKLNLADAAELLQYAIQWVSSCDGQ
ncbi:MAG: LuxR family transcriptional regulator [Phycisphaerae bacterium SG8_4]|nr:MAG: LuxR family transcriptional regulator [Phycisphaerae bacterium SG8_4]